MRPLRTGVVVLNFGDPADTVACLESLEQSDDLDLQVTVVDNGPTGAEHDLLRDLVGTRAEVIATGSNLGYAAGNNIGIEHALQRGVDLVWILNPDTLVEPGTLTQLRAALDEVPDCGVVGPRLISAETPPRVMCDGGVIDLDQYGATSLLGVGVEETSARPRRLVDVDYVMGASLLIRRACVEQVGPIPEQYFLYYEEADWCRRIQAAGWRTMVDQRARTVHHKRSSGLLPKPYYVYYMVRNRYHFAQGCLGLDGERALEQLGDTFIAGWAARVARAAPEWLPVFEELVALAVSDAHAGRLGPNPDIDRFSVPHPTKLAKV